MAKKRNDGIFSDFLGANDEIAKALQEVVKELAQFNKANSQANDLTQKQFFTEWDSALRKLSRSQDETARKFAQAAGSMNRDDLFFKLQNQLLTQSLRRGPHGQQLKDFKAGETDEVAAISRLFQGVLDGFLADNKALIQQEQGRIATKVGFVDRRTTGINPKIDWKIAAASDPHSRTSVTVPKQAAENILQAIRTDIEGQVVQAAQVKTIAGSRGKTVSEVPVMSGYYGKKAASAYKKPGAGSVYADLETIGDEGYGNFAITQLATSGKLGEQVHFLKLSQSVANSMRQSIEELRSNGFLRGPRAENTMRSIMQLAGYFTQMDGSGNQSIGYHHLGWEPGRHISDAYLSKAEKALDILTGNMGGFVNLVDNSTEAIDSILRRQSGQKTGDPLRITTHNGQRFDLKHLRSRGININSDLSLDTYDLAKQLLPLGTVNSNTNNGRGLFSYNLEALADWLGIDRSSTAMPGNPHEGLYDVRLGREVTNALLEYANNSNNNPLKLGTYRNVDLKDKFGYANKSVFRNNPYAFTVDSSGRILFGDSNKEFDWNRDRLLMRGMRYKFAGRQKLNRDQIRNNLPLGADDSFLNNLPGDMLYTLMQDMIGNTIYMPQTNAEFATMVHDVFGGVGQIKKKWANVKDLDLENMLKALPAEKYMWSTIQSFANPNSQSITQRARTRAVGNNGNYFNNLIQAAQNSGLVRDVDLSRLLSQALFESGGVPYSSIENFSEITKNVPKSAQKLVEAFKSAYQNGYLGEESYKQGAMFFDQIKSMSNSGELYNARQFLYDLIASDQKLSINQDVIEGATSWLQNPDNIASFMSHRVPIVKGTDGKLYSGVASDIYKQLNKAIAGASGNQKANLQKVLSSFTGIDSKTKWGDASKLSISSGSPASQNIGGQDFYTFADDTIGGYLTKIANWAAEKELDLLYSFDPNSGSLRLGLGTNGYNADGSPNWENVASWDMPIAGPDGSLLYHGMKMANGGVRYIENGTVGIRGLQEQIAKDIWDSLQDRTYQGKTYNPILDALQRGQTGYVQHRLREAINKHMNPAAPYGPYSIDRESSEYQFHGGSKEQQLTRSFMVQNQEFLEDLLKMTPEGREAIDTKNSFQVSDMMQTLLMDMLYSSSPQLEEAFAQMKENQWIEPVRQYLRTAQEQMGASLADIKEEALLKYITGGTGSTQYRAGARWFSAPGDRAWEQMGNKRELTSIAKQARKDANIADQLFTTQDEMKEIGSGLADQMLFKIGYINDDLLHWAMQEIADGKTSFASSTNSTKIQQLAQDVLAKGFLGSVENDSTIWLGNHQMLDTYTPFKIKMSQQEFIDHFAQHQYKYMGRNALGASLTKDELEQLEFGYNFGLQDAQGQDLSVGSSPITFKTSDGEIVTLSPQSLLTNFLKNDDGTYTVSGKRYTPFSGSDRLLIGNRSKGTNTSLFSINDGQYDEAVINGLTKQLLETMGFDPNDLPQILLNDSADLSSSNGISSRVKQRDIGSAIMQRLEAIGAKAVQSQKTEDFLKQPITADGALTIGDLFRYDDKINKFIQEDQDLNETQISSILGYLLQGGPNNGLTKIGQAIYGADYSYKPLSMGRINVTQGPDYFGAGPHRFKYTQTVSQNIRNMVRSVLSSDAAQNYMRAAYGIAAGEQSPEAIQQEIEQAKNILSLTVNDDFQNSSDYLRVTPDWMLSGQPSDGEVRLSDLIRDIQVTWDKDNMAYRVNGLDALQKALLDENGQPRYKGAYLNLDSPLEATDRFGRSYMTKALGLMTNFDAFKIHGSENLYDLPDYMVTMIQMLRAVNDQSKGWDETNREEYLKQVFNTTLSGHGSLAEKINSTRLGYSGIYRLTGLNAVQHRNWLENGLIRGGQGILNPQDLKDLFFASDGFTREKVNNREQFLNAYRFLYNDLSKANQKQFAQYQNLPEANKLSDDQLKDLLDIYSQMVDARVAEATMFGGGAAPRAIMGDFIRHPLESMYNVMMGGFVASSDVARHTMRLPYGSAELAHADVDGDTAVARLLGLDGAEISKESREKIERVQDWRAKYMDEFTKDPARNYNAKIAQLTPYLNATDEDIQAIANPQERLAIALAAKLNKDIVGKASVLNAGARNVLNDAEFFGDVNQPDNLDKTMLGRLALIPFQGLTESAISAKLIGMSIAQSLQGGGDVDNAEAILNQQRLIKASSGFRNLYKTIMESDYSTKEGAQGVHARIIENMKEASLINSDNFLEDYAAQLAISDIQGLAQAQAFEKYIEANKNNPEAAKNIENWKKKNAYQLSSDTGYQDAIAKYLSPIFQKFQEAYGLSGDFVTNFQSGKIHADDFAKILGAVDNTLIKPGEFANGLFAKARWSKFRNAPAEANEDDVLIRMGSLFGGYTQNPVEDNAHPASSLAERIRQIGSAYGEAGDATSVYAKILQGEIGLEQQKTQVAQNEASALGKATEAMNGLANATSDAASANEDLLTTLKTTGSMARSGAFQVRRNFENGNHYYEAIGADGKSLGRLKDNLSGSKIASLAFGKGRMTQDPYLKAIQASIDKYLGGNALTENESMAFNSLDDGSRKRIFATTLGSLLHEESELVTNVRKAGIADLKEITGIDDQVLASLRSNNQDELATQIESFLQKRVRLFGDQGIMKMAGYSDDDIKKQIEYQQKGVQFIQEQSGKLGQSYAEVSLAGQIGNELVPATLDAAIYNKDTGGWTVADWKTGYENGLNGQQLIQLSLERVLLRQQIQAVQDAAKSKGWSGANWDESKEQAFIQEYAQTHSFMDNADENQNFISNLLNSNPDNIVTSIVHLSNKGFQLKNLKDIPTDAIREIVGLVARGGVLPQEIQAELNKEVLSAFQPGTTQQWEPYKSQYRGVNASSDLFGGKTIQLSDLKDAAGNPYINAKTNQFSVAEGEQGAVSYTGVNSELQVIADMMNQYLDLRSGLSNGVWSGKDLSAKQQELVDLYSQLMALKEGIAGGTSKNNVGLNARYMEAAQSLFGQFDQINQNPNQEYFKQQGLATVYNQELNKLVSLQQKRAEIAAQSSDESRTEEETKMLDLLDKEIQKYDLILQKLKQMAGDSEAAKTAMQNMDAQADVARQRNEEAAQAGATVAKMKKDLEISDEQIQTKAETKEINSIIGAYKKYATNMEQAERARMKASDTGASQEVRQRELMAQQMYIEAANKALAAQNLIYDEIDGKIYRMVDGKRQELGLTDEGNAILTKRLSLEQAIHSAKMTRIQAYTPKEQQGFLGSVFNEFKRSFAYLTKVSLIYGAIGKVKQVFATLIQTVKQLDQAMVNLQIASGNTHQQMKDALVGYNQIAQEMGRTTNDVLAAANDWLRAGYSIADANELIRDSMKLSTLGMIDSAEATKNLISTMKGWKLEASEVSDVVDELTALDMEAAISAGELATAMSKGNASAMLAGSTRQNFEAYITTAADISQQSAETIGTAMKTVFARFGNVKAGKYANSYNASEDNSDEWAKLNDVETVLNKIGISTRDTVSGFRNIDAVFKDIADKWAGLDSVSRNAVTSALGGTRQREVLNILFSNWDEVEKLQKVAKNSSGTADRKMENYTSSIAAAQAKLTASLESMVTGDGIKLWLPWEADKGFQNVNIEKILQDVYGLLANILQNIETIGLTVAGILMLTKGRQIFNALGNFGPEVSGIFGKPAAAIYNLIAGRRAAQNSGITFGEKYYERGVERSMDRIRAATSASADELEKRHIFATYSTPNGTMYKQITGVDGVAAAGVFGNRENTEELKTIWRLSKQKYGGIDVFANAATAMGDSKSSLSTYLGLKEQVLKEQLAGEELTAAKENLARLTNDVAGVLGFEKGATEEQIDARLRAIGALNADGSVSNAERVSKNGVIFRNGNLINAIGSARTDSYEDYKKRPFLIPQSKKDFEKQISSSPDPRFQQIRAARARLNMLSRVITPDNNGKSLVGNYLEALNNQTPDLEEARKALIMKLRLTGNVTDQEIQAKLREIGAINNNNEAIDEDTLKQRMATQAKIEQSERIKFSDTKVGSFLGKNSAMISGMASMAGMMAGGTAGKNIAHSLGEDEGSGQMIGSMAGMGLTMIGSAVGNAIAPGIGGAIGSLVGALPAIIGAVIPPKKTAEDIIEESKKANEQLQEISGKIQEVTSALEENESDSTRWYKLIRGVDKTTGQNVSLNEEEWQDYQRILKNLIDANDDLYASYDENGTLIAKNAAGMANLNEVMSDTLTKQREMVAQSYAESFMKQDKDTGKESRGSRIYAPVRAVYDTYTPSKTEFNKFLDNILDRYSRWETVDYFINKGSKFYTTKDKILESLVKDYNNNLYNGLSNYQIETDWFAMFPEFHRIQLTDTEDRELKRMVSAFATYQSDRLKAVETEYDKQLSSTMQDYLKSQKSYYSLENSVQEWLNNKVRNPGASAFKWNDDYTIAEQMLTDEEMYTDYQRYKAFTDRLLTYATSSDGQAQIMYQQRLNPSQTTVKAYNEAANNNLKSLIENGVFQDNNGDFDLDTFIDYLRGEGYNPTVLHQMKSDLQDKSYEGAMRYLGDWVNTQEVKPALAYINTLKEQIVEKKRAITPKGTGIVASRLVDNLMVDESKVLFKHIGEAAAQDLTSEDTIREFLKQFANERTESVSTFIGNLLNDLKQSGQAVYTSAQIAEFLENSNEEQISNLSDTSTAYQRLDDIAKRLGVDVAEVVKYSSLLGDIDGLGHTTQTLEEVEEKFKSLYDVITDIRDNGKVTLTSLSTMIEKFGEDFLPILDKVKDGNLDDVLKNAEEMYRLQASAYSSVIQTALDNSVKTYKSRVEDFWRDREDKDKRESQTTEQGDVTYTHQQAMGALGNTTNALNFSERINQSSKAGWTGSDNYWAGLNENLTTLTSEKLAKYLAPTEGRTLIQDALEAFGIDDSLSFDKQIDSLFKTLEKQFQEMNFSQKDITSLGLGGMLQILYGEADTGLEYQQFQKMFLESQLQSLKITRNAMEQELKKQKFSSDMSDLDAEWQRGNLNFDTYITWLDKLSKSADATEEQKRQLIEKIEEAKYDKISKDFKNGAIAASEFREQLAELIHLNTADSQDYATMVETYLSSFDQEVSQLQARGNLIQDYDHQAKALNYQEQLNILTAKEAALIAAGRRDTEIELNNRKAMIDAQKNYESELLKSIEYQRQILDAEEKLLGDKDFDSKRAIAMEQAKNDEAYLNQLMENQYTTEEQILQASERYLASQKKILDIEKQRLEYQIKLAEDYFGDYDTIANYEINLLQRRQEVIRDYYDEEISKLEEANNQKQRSIELTKLEMELENARKEKSMVYVAGVGFQAQANKAKVKEAKQNLDNYLEKQHIEDLKNAQQKELNLVQERIDDWNDIKEIVSFTRSEAEATAAVQNLIDTGFLKSNSTISMAASEILGNTKRGLTGQIENLGTKFDNVAKDYIANKGDLQKFIDNYDTEVQKIIDNIDAKWTDQEIGVPAIKGKMDEVSQSVDNFVDDLFTNSEDFKEKYNQACVHLEALAGKDFSPTYSPTIELSGVDSAIKDLEVKIDGVQTLIKTMGSSTPLGDVSTPQVTVSNGITYKGPIGTLKGADGKKSYYNILDEARRGNLVWDNFGNYYLINQAAATSYSNTTEASYRPSNELARYFKENSDNLSDLFKQFYIGDLKGKRGGGSGGAVAEDLSPVRQAFASGIEKGPVNFAGLAQLHGSPSSPEYVLNNKQAYTLLRNLSTMAINPYRAPSVASYRTESASATTYTFGDIYLPNVQKPDEFFDELLRVTKTQFGSIKTNYQHS